MECRVAQDVERTHLIVSTFILGEVIGASPITATDRNQKTFFINNLKTKEL